MILEKFQPTDNDGHTREGLDADSYWSQKLAMYLKRADVLSLESPQGREVVAKHAAHGHGSPGLDLASLWATRFSRLSPIRYLVGFYLSGRLILKSLTNSP